MEFTVIIESEKVRFTLPDGQLLAEIDRSVVLDSDNKIITFGESAETLQKKSPDLWAKIIAGQAKVEDPFSPAEFDPFLAAFVLDTEASIVLKDKFNKSSIYFFKQKIAWNIVFPEYRELDQATRDAFDFAITNMLFVSTKSMRMNDISRDIQVFQSATAFLENFSFVPLLVAIALSWAYTREMLATRQVASLVFALMTGIFWFLNSLLLLLVWKVKFQQAIPHQIMMSMLSSNRFRLPWFLVKWLFGSKKTV